MSYVENPDNAKCLPHEIIKVTLDISLFGSVWFFEVFLLP